MIAWGSIYRDLPIMQGMLNVGVRGVALLALMSLYCHTAAAATLTVGAASRPIGLGNPYDSISTLGSHSRSNILDGLTRQAPDGTLEPALAIEWEATSDLTWEFKMRPGAVFSNGEPADAAAAKATIDFLTREDSARYLIARELRAVERVDVVDSETLVVTTRYPDAIFPKRLSMVMLVPPRAFADMGMDDFAQAPIGTGSYVLEDWGVQSGRSILTANTTSWRAPEHVDRVELLAPLRDAIVRLQALRSGQVDVTVNISVDELDRARADGFEIIVTQGSTIQAIALPNVGNENSPLQDVRVRQALNYAVNKQIITDIILGGTTYPTGQGAIPINFGYNPDIAPYPYDPERAKALLAEAGYPDGFSLVAEVQVGSAPTDDAVYVQIAQDLTRVGVEVELRALIGQEWVRKFFTGDWGEADVLSMTWTTGAYSDTIRAIETFSCAKPGAFFCVQDMMPRIEESNRTFDPLARERMLQDMMADLHDLAPSLFLYPFAVIVAHHPSVENVVIGPGGLMFDRMRLRNQEN